jgi:4-hydroxy-tetrahydrodipicolinate synthase
MPNRDTSVLAASLTPFTNDDTVDAPALVRHVRWLLNNGCGGALLFGTTGEGLSLTVDERIDALGALLDADLPAGRLLVGTGAPALPDAVRLTRAATAQGVRGVLVLPPFHFREISDEGVFRFYDHLIQRVDDPALRLYFYHHPELSGVALSFPVIQRLNERHSEQVAGVKDSSGEWDHTEALIRSFPDLEVFAGTERLLLPALRAGGSGCISATVNLTAPVARQVHEAWRTGQDAARLQDRLTSLRGSLARFSTIAALKQVCAWQNTMGAAVRAPLARLSDEQQEMLRPVAAQMRAETSA